MTSPQFYVTSFVWYWTLTSPLMSLGRRVSRSFSKDHICEISVEIESQGQATVYGMDRTHSIKPWGSAKRSTKQKACWIGELDINEEGLEPLDDYSFKVCAW